MPSNSWVGWYAAAGVVGGITFIGMGIAQKDQLGYSIALLGLLLLLFSAAFLIWLTFAKPLILGPYRLLEWGVPGPKARRGAPHGYFVVLQARQKIDSFPFRFATSSPAEEATLAIYDEETQRHIDPGDPVSSGFGGTGLLPDDGGRERTYRLQVYSSHPIKLLWLREKKRRPKRRKIRTH